MSPLHLHGDQSSPWEHQHTSMVIIITMEPTPVTYVPLSISPQALLTRLAQTPAGSRELLAANCIGYLTQCHFIDLRPDYHGNQPGGLLDPIVAGFVPSVSDRYRQLLSPLLKLLLTVLTCPGAQRSEVKAQVNPSLFVRRFSNISFAAGNISNWSPHRYLYCHPQEPSGLSFHGNTGGVVISDGGHRSLWGRSRLE